ncbi:cyclin-dependent kinase 2-like [Babylonia areolata]|uniref:cyclin-dependent kinase 2-like n=1 Tax=Babylonia areolata TaxID=304850 RepID=UPI003FD29B89
MPCGFKEREVYQMRHKATGRMRAVKCVSDLQGSRKEMNLLTFLNRGDVHGFVDQDRHCLVFDRLQCNLEKWVHALHPGGVDLRVFKVLATRMLAAFEYLGSKGILHGDVKPNNFLMASEDPGSLKVCDFGLSQKLPSENTPLTYRRTMGIPSYRAPEVMLGYRTEYAMAADVWAVGCVLLYGVLCRNLFPLASDGRDASEKVLSQMCSLVGRPPRHMLDGAQERRLCDLVSTFHCPVAENSDPLESFLVKELHDVRGHDRSEVTELHEFIRELMVLDPDKRMRPAEAVQHPFFHYPPCGTSDGSTEVSADFGSEDHLSSPPMPSRVSPFHV